MELLLDRLLGSDARRLFFEAHWSRRPWARESGAEPHAPLVGEERLAALLADPACDVVLVRDGAVVERERPRTLEAARDALGAGATVAFRHVERNDTELAALGRRLSAELQGAPNVHVYWSPPGRGSFGWHCDPEEVFLFQIRGAKRYRFRANTRHPWPLARAMGAAGSAAHERGPIESCTLAPGAWLYLPAGWWHDTQAETESLAISVGLLAPAPIDLVDFVVAELARDPQWRARMPAPGLAVPGTDAEKLDAWRAVLASMAEELAERLRDERLPQRYLLSTLNASRRPPAG